MPLNVNSTDGPVFQNGTTTLHSRASVTTGAATLGSFCSPVAPTILADATLDGTVRYPKAALLSAEVGSTACYVTWDGVSVPAATLGFLVPTAPAAMRIPVYNPAAIVKAVAGSGTATVQVSWEF